MSFDETGRCKSGCTCGKGCNGSPQVPVSSESPAAAETLVLGVAPVKMHYEVSETRFGAEGGPNCSATLVTVSEENET